MAILRGHQFKVRAVYPSEMNKLIIRVGFLLKIVSLLFDIYYLLFYHHVKMLITYLLVASIIIPFIILSKIVTAQRKEIEKYKEKRDIKQLTWY